VFCALDLNLPEAISHWRAPGGRASIRPLIIPATPSLRCTSEAYCGEIYRKKPRREPGIKAGGFTIVKVVWLIMEVLAQ
jgi:hypothetical protein